MYAKFRFGQLNRNFGFGSFGIYPFWSSTVLHFDSLGLIRFKKRLLHDLYYYQSHISTILTISIYQIYTHFFIAFLSLNHVLGTRIIIKRTGFHIKSI